MDKLRRQSQTARLQSMRELARSKPVRDRGAAGILRIPRN
jgi:hypothetical protein